MNKFISTLHRICEPEPGTFPTDIDRKLRAKRNERFLFIQILMLTLLIVKILFLNRTQKVSDYWFISLFCANIIVFCLFVRPYPHFFKLFYAATITVSGPGALYFDERNGIFGGLVIAFLAPLILLYFSDCREVYVTQIVIQLVLMYQYYHKKLVEAINLNTSEDFVKSLVRSQMFAIGLSSILTYSIGFLLLQNLKQEVLSKEIQRKELEVQKNFVLSFSHEIRNLINNLTGNIQLSLLEDLSSKVKGYLEDAEIGAGLLLQLINNILDTGNLAVGEPDINQSNQRIHNTLEKVWRICAYALKTKYLKGKLQIMKRIPRNLKLDHERFMQIMVNLVLNAVKFTERGTIDIKLEWIPNTMSVSEVCFYPSPFDDENEGIFEKDQAFSVLGDDFTIVGVDSKTWSSRKYSAPQETGHGLLKVTVTDTGYGVMPENIPKVFDRFSSEIFGDESTSKKLGTTIGLYVTKELCNMMGGDIKVFSKLDKGTSFIACIPVEQAMPEKLAHTCSKVFSLGDLPEEKKLTAMIVDDMQFNIIVLTNYLERMKLKVADTAVNGLDAFNKYVESAQAGQKFDIVTLDVEMPVMDGKEAAMKIREFEKENNIEPCLIIMISGNVCESEISKCLRYNGNVLANYFLKKPANFDDIFKLIKEHFAAESQNSIPTDGQEQEHEQDI